MTKVLLTGGSGFIAAHVLEGLLQKGYSVVTTVRTEDKAQKIREAYPQHGKDTLDFAIVPDIAQPDAFDHVLVEHTGFDAVLHTASPFHFNVTDAKKDLIDPAVIGTTSVLTAIAKSPKASSSIKRVVITSSFAAIVDAAQCSNPNHTFTEASWNPVTIDQINESPSTAYRASKTLAEKAAWKFLESKEYKDAGCKFDIVTVNPPMVYGPVVHHLASLSAINTSNARIVALVQGKWREAGKIPETGAVFNWIDVRDVATAHVLAVSKQDLGGKRLFVTAGEFSHREMADITRAHFPELKDKLPTEDMEGGEKPAVGERYKWDNSVTKRELGMEWIGFEKCMVDTVKSLQPFL